MMTLDKNTLKRIFLHLHKLGIRIGVHILPVHYYSPVPDIVKLQQTQHIWAKKSKLPGIPVNLDEQVRHLEDICVPYQHEYEGNHIYLEGVSQHYGPGYGYIEAQALHSVIRHYKPARVIEVGSGVSSYCIVKAAKKNREETGNDSFITCIEPYPSDQLTALTDIKLISRQVQEVPFEVFASLREKDILFIDSSHTVKPGSDVNYLILEVLPRLRPGVIVHFHDIYLPYDYQRGVLQTFLHWTETSLLRAFLIFNNRAKILFCLSHLHYDCQDALKEVFPDYIPQDDCNGLRSQDYKPFASIQEHFPSSIYIQIQ